MNEFEAISIILSVLAIVVSILAYTRANSIATRANEIALGNIELYIRERITSTRERVNSMALSMGTILSKQKKTSDDKRMLEIYEKAFNEAIEDNINAYEDACAKYLDNKVDQKRFEKLYKVEIRQLVQNVEYKKYFDGITSTYRCILKVYEQWENPEK